ncbi:MAG: type II toxin-antitoxin system RelE/ParE family toxin [Nitrospinae bacterium]|nr:type II toxin-antitoxin system RelE/ParE family toxin [Nitrospinota bacterium]
MQYRIEITPSPLSSVDAITDRRVRNQIIERLDRLAENPASSGKPLSGEFAGYRSERAAGQRYRIIYRVDEQSLTVIVVALGIRKEGSKKDIYQLAKKLLRSGLLGG